MPGYIKLYRDIQEHWIYKDSDYLKVWIEILLRARYIKEPKTDTHKGTLYTIHYGQFLYGRPTWSERLGIGEQKLRSIMSKLTRDDMIRVITSLPKSTLYEVVNYEKFNMVECWVSAGSQLVDGELNEKTNHHNNHVPDIERSSTERNSNQQNNQRPPSRQPADNQQTTNNEEGKKDKKEKNIKDYSLEIENFRQRYSDFLDLIDKYFDVLRTTRVSGKISESIIHQVYTEMNKHSVVVVKYACKTVVENPRLHDKKENYFYGIMRGTKSEEAEAKLQAKTGQPEQSKYRDLRNYKPGD